ncbi:MAG: MarR family transcriptional regulator [Desulfotignum sp.]|nr:MarR family transcriptional regulator [Desulfotignum sp.]
MINDTTACAENSHKSESRRHFLEDCLFFSVNAISRQLLKLAEAEFASLKLSPAHASLMLILYDNPGINPKKLGEFLQLSPSTITRFIDALARKKLVRRKNCGRNIAIFPTQKGLEAKPAIAQAYKAFYLAYTRMLGDGNAHRLAMQIHQASQRLAKVSAPENLHDPDL